MSNITCQQDYTVTIDNPCFDPTGYWNLDETAGSVNRADSVGTHPFVPTGVTAPGSPAVINDGVIFTAAFGGSGYQTSGAIAYTAGNSFSVWGWIKVNATGGSAAVGGPLCAFVMSAFEQIYISGGSNTDPQPFRVSTRHDDAYLNLSLGAFHFFHLFFDASVNKYGYAIDNGAKVFLPTVVAIPNAANGLMQLNQNFTAATGSVLFDEIGLLVTSMLTDAQVTALYNSGAGQRLLCPQTCGKNVDTIHSADAYAYANTANPGDPIGRTDMYRTAPGFFSWRDDDSALGSQLFCNCNGALHQFHILLNFPGSFWDILYINNTPDGANCPLGTYTFVSSTPTGGPPAIPPPPGTVTVTL